jgi:chromosome segregation protein
MPRRLKSLELQGYKTFASRTLFEFSDMVTAIVGPNGSGKSNIADSLRWVLGEQSYSLLRGRKTEDMIFAGSESRSRAGMASATITFDNQDSWLPIDFGEVAIARRAYRDGQNEYLINGQKVRLKDISELLAQSGLAERTYTIIGQGLVDAALALKAEERRRLFEEAAGIGLHRSRREEALKRLDMTRRNLERIQDILAELHPRLRSLERQARRAQEYGQVMDDLRVLLREWYGYHWHRTQKELKEARELAQARETALDAARLNQEALNNQLAGLRDQIQALRASLNSWHRQSAQLHTRRETLSRELAVADERIRSIKEQLQNASSELTRLEEEVGLHQERARSAEQDVSRLQAELFDARAQVNSAQQNLNDRLAERAAMEEELQSSRQKNGALLDRQSKLQARLMERQNQVERSQQALEEAYESVQKVERELGVATEELQVAQIQHEKAGAARQQAENALQSQRERMAEADSSRKSLVDQRSYLIAEQARLKAQIEVLEQAETALTGYAGGTRLLLDAARSAKLEGAEGALSSRLDVPAELETAIAAALGEYLDAVLLTDQPDSALDLLSSGLVRGVLLPVKTLKPESPISPAARIDGVYGIAADLVKVAPEYRPAVDLLLGQVLVVRDRQTARRILDLLSAESIPHHLRAVTMKGEVFMASGPVLAGSGGSGEQSLLSRRRQQRELQEAIGQSQRNIAAATTKLAALDEQVKQIQQQEKELAENLQMKRQSEEAASKDLNQARLAHEQALRQANWQQEQRKRLEIEIERDTVQAAEIKAELAGLEKEIDQIRSLVRDRSATLAGLSADEFRSQLGHWSTQAAVAERALADGKARLQERQNALERAIRRRNELQSRITELQRSLELLGSEKGESRQSEAGIAEEIASFRSLIDPAELELAQLEDQQTGLQKSEAAARQSLSQAEHYHAQARISLARRQESLETLRHRVEDDFGLVAFEYAEDVSGPTPLPLEGMVEQLPRVRQLGPEIEENIKRQRAQLRRMGAINPEAQKEFEEVKERFKFLTEQVADLEKAERDVHEVIEELDAIMEREFVRTFDAVAGEFKQIFTRLFGGGSARLVLTNPDDLTDTGIDIEARLPGRRSQGLSLLSGGERSLTATALVFSLLKISPTPFCVLDEVDAMLDEANVGRFRELLRELSQNTQFVVVTHNRNTVQAADVIYGVTMGRDTASQVLSLKLDEVSKLVE